MEENENILKNAGMEDSEQRQVGVKWKYFEIMEHVL